MYKIKSKTINVKLNSALKTQPLTCRLVYRHIMLHVQ